MLFPFLNVLRQRNERVKSLHKQSVLFFLQTDVNIFCLNSSDACSCRMTVQFPQSKKYAESILVHSFTYIYIYDRRNITTNVVTLYF